MIKIVCISECADCIVNKLYLCDEWILDKSLPCVYKWGVNGEDMDCYFVYDVNFVKKGMILTKNFITLASFREKRINSILDDN
jgi:hypothetical protein